MSGAPSAVTIGKFDGVHTGHLAVLERLVASAGERGIEPVVVTFDRHPLSVLDPSRVPRPLTSLRKKRELLEAAGARVVVLPFDDRLRGLAPDEFVQQVLVEQLDARLVLVGSDFRYGSRGAGDVASLRSAGGRHGFEVEAIDDVLAPTGERASSTGIRALLDAGRVREATRMLGRAPTVRSTVVPGEQRGRELGYPTANLHPDLEGYLPCDGVYAVVAVVDGVRYPAACSIGNNPTFEGVPARQVEVHLFDVRIDLYGREIEVEFVDFIRPMMRFMGIEALVAQLERDDDEIRELLGAPPRR